MNDESKRCHLDMIQGIITRMGNNSFALKGWSVGIMIAIKVSFIKIMFSKSVLPFYLVCFATTLIIYFVKF